MFELNDNSSVKELRTLHSDSCANISQQVLSRSVIFSASTEGYLSPSQDHPSRLLVAAGDEKTFNVCNDQFCIEIFRLCCGIATKDSWLKNCAVIPHLCWT